MSGEKEKKILRALLKLEDNKYCADCTTKKPTWASINIGVFLCLHCAGIHRDMGVHISKVRSVELDTWQPEWVEVMKKWGNSRANKYWEARMPKSYEGKPNEVEAQALSHKMKKFIRDKYERRMWIGDSLPSENKITEKVGEINGDDAERKRQERRVRRQNERPIQRPDSVKVNNSTASTFQQPAKMNAGVSKAKEVDDFDLLGSFDSFKVESTGEASRIEVDSTPFVEEHTNLRASASAQTPTSTDTQQSSYSAKTANIMALFQQRKQSAGHTTTFQPFANGNSQVDVTGWNVREPTAMGGVGVNFGQRNAAEQPKVLKGQAPAQNGYYAAASTQSKFLNGHKVLPEPYSNGSYIGVSGKVSVNGGSSSLGDPFASLM